MLLSDIKNLPFLQKDDAEFLNFSFELVKNKKLPSSWKDFPLYHHTCFNNTTNILHAISHTNEISIWHEIFPFLFEKLGEEKIFEFLLMKQKKSFRGNPLAILLNGESLEVASFLLNQLPKKIILTTFIEGETEDNLISSIIPTKTHHFWDVYFKIACKAQDKIKALENAFDCGLTVSELTQTQLPEKIIEEAVAIEECYLFQKQQGKNKVEKKIHKLQKL